MNIIVCIKQIMDPVTAPSFLLVDQEKMRVIPKDPKFVKMVVSDYDLNAVEAAMQIKDAIGCTVTVVSLGSDAAYDSIRQCIAMGADTGILVKDENLDDSNIYSTAYALSQAIKKIGDYDLVLCGVEEGDWDAGQVGTGISKFLKIPCITAVGKIDLKDIKLKVERIADDGRELLEVQIPALLTVRNEVGTPRYPTMKKIMAAKKAVITTWSASDINADEKYISADSARTKMKELYIPVQVNECYYVKADTPEAAGAKLAEILKDANLI